MDTRRQSPYLHKPAIVIVTSFSLWRHSHYDVIGATPTVTDVRTNERTDTLPRLIYKDITRAVERMSCR